MKEVKLPDCRQRGAAFFLAMEEWVARNMPAGEYCFWWVVPPTVVFGRNQDMEAEVNTAYCREHGIKMVRRRSGGGCIYADGHNIMTSFVTPDTDVTTTFADFTRRIAAQLRKMGIDAEATGRNDIAVGGRKISGNAFYHLPGRSIVHGTMLYDTDMTNMLMAITPSAAKLESKQVKSVRSRIVTARELCPHLSFADFRNGLSHGIADSEIVLTPGQVTEIEELEQRYYDPRYLYGSRRRGNMRTCYIPGVGTIGAAVTLTADGKIDSVELSGDFFDTAEAGLEQVLQGLRGKASDDIVLPENLIPGLSSRELARMITEN